LFEASVVCFDCSKFETVTTFPTIQS